MLAEGCTLHIIYLQDLDVVLIQMQQVVHVLRLQKNPKHDGLITTVGHIAESDSDVQCCIQSRRGEKRPVCTQGYFLGVH